MNPRSSTLVLIALSLGAPLCAQSFFVSPPAHTSLEGVGFAWALGSTRQGRAMFFDGELRNHAMTIKGLAYRLDYQDFGHLGTLASGRSWTKVTIDMSTCDMANLSPTFALNPTSTQTQVFSASVSWPTHTFFPASKPAPFDYSFPFTTNWQHTGKSAVCIDYRFEGGTLANNQPWSSRSNLAYYLDSYAEHSEASSSSLGNTGSGGCIDSASATRQSAYLESVCTHYGPDAPARRNTVRFYFYGFEIGPSAPCVTALGFRALPTGLPFPGIACNRIHVDPSFLVLMPQVANSSGILPPRFVPNSNGVPTNAGYVGVPLVLQTMWGDTRTGLPRLSAAATATVPGLPSRYDREMTMTVDGTARGGSSPTFSSQYNPICRYTK